MEDIERRATLQDQALGQHGIAGDLLEDIHEPQDLLERGGLQTRLSSDPLQRLGGRRGHDCPSNVGFTTLSGRITRHLDANLPPPGLAPSA